MWIINDILKSLTALGKGKTKPKPTIDTRDSMKDSFKILACQITGWGGGGNVAVLIKEDGILPLNMEGLSGWPDLMGVV